MKRSFLIPVMCLSLLSTGNVFAKEQQITYSTNMTVTLNSDDMSYEVCASDSAGSSMKGCTNAITHSESNVLTTYSVDVNDTYLEPGLAILTTTEKINNIDIIDGDNSCTYASTYTTDEKGGARSHVEFEIPMDIYDYSGKTFNANVTINYEGDNSWEFNFTQCSWT